MPIGLVIWRRLFMHAPRRADRNLPGAARLPLSQQVFSLPSTSFFIGTLLPMPLRPAGPDDIGQIGALITELAEYEKLHDQVGFDIDELATWLFGPDPVAQVTLAEAVDSDGTTRIAGFAL